MRYDAPSAQLFVRNRQDFVAAMEPGTVAVFFSGKLFPSNSDAHFPFTQNSNTYYLSGIDQAETILVLFPDSPEEKWKEMLFVSPTSKARQLWEGHRLSPEQARKHSGIGKLFYTDQFENSIRTLLPWTKGIYLDFNEHEFQQHTTPQPAHAFADKVTQEFPGFPILRAAPILRNLRTRKSPLELGQMAEAANITGLAFEKVLQMVKPGIYEYEVEAEIQATFLRNRATGPAYPSIVATGENACVLHYIQNKSRCREGDLLLMDFGAEYGCYSADLSRTIPVSGRFTAHQKKLYNAVLSVLIQTRDFLKPGLTLKEVQKVAGEFMTEQLLNLGLLSAREVQESKTAYRKYFMHGVSHHIGLDTHDFCERYEAMPAGSVLTIEPGIYLPDEKTGIRLENVVVIEENGARDLMAHIPIEAEEIEEKMRPR